MCRKSEGGVFIKESTGDKTLYKVLIAWFPYKPGDDDANDNNTPTPSPKRVEQRPRPQADKPLPITIKKEKIEHVDSGRQRLGAATTRALARIKQDQGDGGGGGDEDMKAAAERAHRLAMHCNFS